jgi:hypothetical protein
VGITCRQIRARNLKIYGGLLLRLVLGVKKAFGGRAVFGEKAGLLFVDGIFKVESISPEKQNESALHVHDLFRAS